MPRCPRGTEYDPNLKKCVTSPQVDEVAEGKVDFWGNPIDTPIPSASKSPDVVAQGKVDFWGNPIDTRPRSATPEAVTAQQSAPRPPPPISIRPPYVSPRNSAVYATAVQMPPTVRPLPPPPPLPPKQKTRSRRSNQIHAQLNQRLQTIRNRASRSLANVGLQYKTAVQSLKRLSKKDTTDAKQLAAATRKIRTPLLKQIKRQAKRVVEQARFNTGRAIEQAKIEIKRRAKENKAKRQERRRRHLLEQARLEAEERVMRRR